MYVFNLLKVSKSAFIVYIKFYIRIRMYMSACSHLLCTTSEILGNTYVCRILDKLKSAKKDLKTYLFQLVFAHSRHSRTFIIVTNCSF